MKISAKGMFKRLGYKREETLDGRIEVDLNGK
jgi:hypothetical protein